MYSVLINKYISYAIGVIHMGIILLNVLSIPLVLIHEPFYIWMPIITVLVSPVIGGTYCIFNRIENHFRVLGGLEPINDRFESFCSFLIRRKD